MAVLTLAINTKDNSSGAINTISNSFSKLSNSVEIAKGAVKSAGAGFLNITAGVGGVITIINAAINIFKKLDEAFKKIGGEAGKSWEDLKSLFSAIGKIVSDLVVPAISSVSKGILAFVKSADGLKFISSLAGSIAAGFTILQNVLSVLYNVIKDSILKAFTDIKERMEQTTSANEMLTGGLNFLKGIVIALSVAFNIAVNTIKLVTIAIIDLAEVVKTAGELLGQIFTGQWDKVGESAKKVGEKFKNLTINLKDNFGDIVNGAIETANKIDKGFDVKKIADDTKKSFNDVKNNVENSLKSINTTVAESNDIIKDDILIFTNELKKAYEEYVSLKKDLVEKNYKNEQEYFDKLNKLNELQKIKGIKELEDYYSKKNDVVKKNEESLLQQISKTLQGFNFGNFIKDVEDEMGKLINSVINATSQISVAFVKMAADIKDNWKKINESNLSETEKNIEKMKLLFGSIGTAVGSVFNAIGGIVSGSMNYYTKQIEAEISAIENKYKGLFDSLDKTREDNLKRIDEDLEKELEAIGIRNETELEQAQSRLEQLQELERNFRDVEAEERLARLEEYYASIQSQTDEEIRLAYERQKAKILEGEEKKKIDLQEQISTQQKEVAKLQAIENANKKKLELEQQYEAKKKELEKQRIAEMNAKEQQIFEANKATQIANVWVATAVGIATAWATAMQLGPIAGPIMGAILSTLLLTNAGVQTGLIASQNYTPKNFATGGVIVGEAGRELVELPRGARVYNNDETERMLEGREVIINNNIFIDSEKIMNVLIKKRLNLSLR